MRWLLSSDIRIKKGKNKGAFYGWKNLKPVSFPFIYSEITGYAITCLLWIHAEFRNFNALEAAKESAEWILKNSHSYLVVARPSVGRSSINLSNLLYSFDNGMIMIGLLNLYNVTKDKNFLVFAEKVTQALIEHFFDGEKLTARLSNSYQPVTSEYEDGIVRWSTVPGAYHCKLSIGLLELSRLTGKTLYVEVSNLLCNYATSLQNSDGRFITNPGSDIVHLHPHLYACEGLIYSGLKQTNEDHYRAGLDGLIWAMAQLGSSSKALFRHTGAQSIEQSDCTAQLLRLLVLCRSELKNTLNDELDNVIERLHSRLLDFHIPFGEGKGAMRYQLALETACSWCTMFTMQALRLWSVRNSIRSAWIDYFI